MDTPTNNNNSADNSVLGSHAVLNAYAAEETASMTEASTNSSHQLDNRLQVVIWLKEHYRLGEVGSMRKSFVYQHYLDACRESGMEGAPISHTFFGKLVRRAFPGIKCNRKGPRGDAHQCYTHLERLSVAQRLGAWQVEQITEELAKCSSAGASPSNSRFSPLRPKSSARSQRLQLGSESDEAVTPSSTQPSTPIDENEYHHHGHHHQDPRCFSSCCSPHSSSQVSPQYSSPRSSCCSEGTLEDTRDFPVVEQEPGCSCPLLHPHHQHTHRHGTTSNVGAFYDGYLDETQLYTSSSSNLPPYVVTPFQPAYPHHYTNSLAGSFTPQLHFPVSPSHESPTSPALYLSGELEDHCGIGPDVHASGATSFLLAQHDSLSFTDYLAACQAARAQPLTCGAGPTTSADGGDHHDELQRGEDLSWADGCHSRTVEPLALSWASSGASWTDAIY